VKIEWEIKKKRGNWRPVLTYSAQWEEWEQNLAPGEITIITKIPVPKDHYKHYCPPGQYERAEPPEYKEMDNKTRYWCFICPISREEIRLPWRPGAQPEYPEVEEAFLALREAAEKAVQEALASEGWEKTGTLDMSPEYKKAVAGYVTARRMLEGVKK